METGPPARPPRPARPRPKVANGVASPGASANQGEEEPLGSANQKPEAAPGSKVREGSQGVTAGAEATANVEPGACVTSSAGAVTSSVAALTSSLVAMTSAAVGGSSVAANQEPGARVMSSAAAVMSSVGSVRSSAATNEEAGARVTSSEAAVTSAAVGGSPAAANEEQGTGVTSSPAPVTSPAPVAASAAARNSSAAVNEEPGGPLTSPPTAVTSSSGAVTSSPGAVASREEARGGSKAANEEPGGPVMSSLITVTSSPTAATPSPPAVTSSSAAVTSAEADGSPQAANEERGTGVTSSPPSVTSSAGVMTSLEPGGDPPAANEARATDVTSSPAAVTSSLAAVTSSAEAGGSPSAANEEAEWAVTSSLGSLGSLAGGGGGELDSVSVLSGALSALGDDVSSLGSDSEAAGPAQRRADRYGFLGGSQYSHAPAAVPLDVGRQRELKWLEMFSHWDKWLARRYQKVKLRCRKGIPSSLRARAWQLLSGSQGQLEQHPGLFQELERQPGDPRWLDAIEKDLHRQFPFHEMFIARGGHGQQDLYRVLKAYTVLRPEEGYCQAQAPVAAVLLMHMPAEQAFWVLVQICDLYLPGYYSAGLEAVQLDGEVLVGLLRRALPGAHRHLRRLRVEPVLFLTEWFMCLFARSLPWGSVLRVWDMFFCEGVKVLFRVGVVLLRQALGTPEKLRSCPGLYETLERLRSVSPPGLPQDRLLRQVTSVPVSEALLERERAAQLRRWRETRGELERPPRPPLHGARAIRLLPPRPSPTRDNPLPLPER